MKFLHLADLHLGKSIHGVSLLESGDQPVWVQRFLEMAQEICPDAVVIAGDVYDRSAPSGDAVALLDRMITGLSELKIPVLVVPGNHDSGQRMSFAGSLLAKENIHIAGVLRACLKSFDKRRREADNREKQAGVGGNASISK